MFSGAWPEGTRLRIKATRDPADVDLNGQAWHTEGRTYELEVRAEDEWGGVTVIRHAYAAGAGQQPAWTLPRLGQLVIMGDMIAFFQVRRPCYTFTA